MLRLAESSREAWEHVIAPWCERVFPDCWKRDLPALIIVPTRGHANALKERLLRDGKSHFGLYFLTPMALRKMFATDENRTAAYRARPSPAPRLAATETPDDLTAKSVARSPGPLLRALDRLEMAGWKFERSCAADVCTTR